MDSLINLSWGEVFLVTAKFMFAYLAITLVFVGLATGVLYLITKEEWK